MRGVRWSNLLGWTLLLGVASGCAGPPTPPAGPAAIDIEYAPPPDEVTRVLGRLAQSVRSYFQDNDNAFPKGKTKITPTGNCCAHPDRTCAADETAWEDGIWSDMSFSWGEPTQFHYRYEGDRRRFSITAVGDPECTGASRTYVLTGHGSRRTGMVLDDVAMLRSD